MRLGRRPAPLAADGPVLYVVDARGWVGERRVEHLERHLDVRFEVVTAAEYGRSLRRRRRRPRPTYFSTWRILHGLEERGSGLTPEDERVAMASVTSHQNLGGGLDPARALPAGIDPGEALEEAARLLRRLTVVTANSSGLHALLRPHVPGLVYAPNGVDEVLFAPGERAPYDGSRLRVGWVAKLREAKNHDTLARVAEDARSLGIEVEGRPVPKDAAPSRLDDAEAMRDWYRTLDFYLCASWHEGTPNPALEAAACGVPPVTTRVGNMVDLVRDGENGFFVDPSPASIVSRLRALRDLTPARYADLSAAVRRTIEAEWTWERNVGPYREALRRLRAAAGLP